jgi:hypothetical protein
MIANAFDLPPMLLGLTRCQPIHRRRDGRRGLPSAIVPVAKLIAEHITRDLFAKLLGWREFEFVFNDLESRDETEELNIQVQLLQNKVLTISEVRQMRGLSPLPAKDGEEQLSS